jgi:hypothetical protein
MAIEFLHEIAERVRNLQGNTRQGVEPEKLREVTALALELVRAVADLEERILELEREAPRRR